MMMMGSPHVFQRCNNVIQIPWVVYSFVISLVVGIICSIIFTFRHTASQKVANGIERMWEHMRQVCLPAVAYRCWCQIKRRQVFDICIRQLQ